MPELPEVEVVRATLENQLAGLTILGIDCYYEPIIENLVVFKTKVIDRKICAVKRYAKYLIFILEDGAFLSHLRMEGKYFYVPKDYPISKHQHIVFHLSNGNKLIYQDVRKFGRMEYKSLDEIYSTPPISKLGVEANSKEYNLEELYQKLANKRIPIKTILLNQEFISGLGNIYVDEVLYASHICPLRIGAEIKKEELEQILLMSQAILDEAIRQKGTTIRSYTSSLGVSGNYQTFLKAHSKEFCPICEKRLIIEKIGGRTSYYCKKCQR
ncbi:MAG: bifunctional DNA-formamidopyrimidine glycosylase/DNA-(apurinic or apyrimidinic site) lyase [Anaeroplasmataceae bacterium]|nr:bifunctional DNA-formamidopyrimidine glycosylase/DNA-(apurinic or apyrimidinic site) lyase [Anaeroplasmataceae bacterium]